MQLIIVYHVLNPHVRSLMYIKISARVRYYRYINPSSSLPRQEFYAIYVTLRYIYGV